MVHTNNFCEMGLELSDPRKELWTKTEIWEGWGISKFSFEVQNGLLRDSDWVSGSDVTMSTAWRTYRQALRDVPTQEGFPNTVTWPTKPS